MKRIAFISVCLFVFAAGFSTAQEANRRILVSIKPEIDVPLPPDPFLFKPGGGVAVSGKYILPFFRPLSAGVAVNFHLGRMRHTDLGNLGSLSVLSAEITTELRLTFRQLLDAYFSVGAGYFYVFLNGESSSSVSNLVLNGRIGAGLRVTPTMTVGIQGEYRRYLSLYHLMGIGLGLDFPAGKC